MSSQPKSFSTNGVILKRRSIGETDRLVTILTQDFGKIVVIAKGARKMQSSKRALLEPGTYIQAFCISTRSLPLLTQAKGINDFAGTRDNLIKIRQLTQILEVIDRLFVEEEPQAAEFELVLDMLHQLDSNPNAAGYLKQSLEKLCVMMGYQHPNQSKYNSILDYIADLSDRPMRSWDYLKTTS